MKIHLCAKISGGNAFSGGLHAFFRVLELEHAAARGDGHISFQVVESEGTHAVSPFFLSGQSVDGELQTLVGIFLRARFSGLVIEDHHAAVGSAVDAVNAPDYGRFAKANLE